MGVLLLLGFSSGLPLLLTGGTPLQAWLTEAGLSKTTIGLSALLGIPYSFKFVWSPLLDRFIPPLAARLRGSRRRGWMALTQILLILSIGLLGFQNPAQFQIFFTVAMAVAFFSATQDIAVDAYRTDVLTEPEMGAGAAIFVTGYRIALLVSGGFAVYLADFLPWSQVYALMAALMLVGLIVSYFAPEPEGSSQAPQSLQAAVFEPFRAFWQQHSQAGLILLFIVLYKLADGLAGQMATTFLLETGFSKTDLGLIRSVVGLIATLAGAFIGGALVNRSGILRALWFSGILQGISNLSFTGLALLGQNYPGMVGVITIENFCGGMGTSAFLAFLMSLCDRQFTATQYALLSSLFAVGGTVAGSFSGYLAEQMAWAPFFALTAAGALPGLAILLLIRPTKPPGPNAFENL
ncbi:AmpG family muropeptide MFS transporter [Leptolyngbya sp. FACHB-261]|nr:AmpG family muropeptide MFS transporter [Leptolyngbya sp. FACHB-261]